MKKDGEHKFKKGQSGNPNGRPKGVPNKTTDEARAMFMDIMSGQVDKIEGALNDLYQESPAMYLNTLSKLFPYFIPKKTDITTDGKELSRSFQIEIVENKD